MSRCGTGMYMSPEVTEYKPYGAASDTYGLGCILLEMLLRHQLRERRPFEERKDYISEALEAAHGHGWETFDRMSDLVWRMLDEHPKTRVGLPDAATAAAAAASSLACASQASTTSNGRSVDSSATATLARLHSETLLERRRPSKRVSKTRQRQTPPLAKRQRRMQQLRRAPPPLHATLSPCPFPNPDFHLLSTR